MAAASRKHLDIDRAAIVLVGDADAFGSELEAAGVGTVVIERDEGPHVLGPVPDETEAAAAAVDATDDSGPTVGAKDPDLPGTADDPVGDTRPDDEGDTA